MSSSVSVIGRYVTVDGRAVVLTESDVAAISAVIEAREAADALVLRTPVTAAFSLLPKHTLMTGEPDSHGG